MREKIAIIGSGFSSLSASCYLSKAGFDVTILEKNNSFGGRARQFKKDGFTFDIGPSWYWMPDIFENFFNDFNEKRESFYDLEKLDPAYEVYFGPNDSIKIGDSLEKIFDAFEKEEKGSSLKLKKFIKKCESNYDIAVRKLLPKMPGISPTELITKETILKFKYFLTNIKTEVERDFKNPKLSQILQFPVLFLGAKPSDTPAFYNFMNYADFGLGTWHPKKGMYSIVEGMVKLAKKLGVKLKKNITVSEILVSNKQATGLIANGQKYVFDIILSGADYAHSESLLNKKYRVYNNKYWLNKTFAPSSLLFFIGLDKKIKNVSHHTLFFDGNFDEHAKSIYDNPEWPKNPLFYCNFPSISDPHMAPKNKEACFILIPLAPGIKDSKSEREKYFKIVLKRLESLTNQKIEDSILFKESYCLNEFINDYNSYKGNAYGMANTLMQTAFLRPKLKSKKVDNLFFTGQLTVPGPGVPPALISGKLVSKIIEDQYLEV